MHKQPSNRHTQGGGGDIESKVLREIEAIK